MKQPAKSVSLAEQIAWYCLLAVPIAVPLAMSKIPFAAGDVLTYYGFLVPKLFALCVLVGGAMVGWAVALLRGELTPRSVPARGWLGAFVGLTVLSTLVALDRPTALFGQPSQHAGLFTILVCAALFLLVTQLVSDVRRLRHLARSAMVGGAVVGAVGLLQFSGIDALVTPTQTAWMVSRGYSTIGNPDFTGTYLVLPLVLALALALGETDRRWRIAAWVSAVVMLPEVFITLTRGAWLAVPAGLILLAVVAKRAGLLSWRALAASTAGAASLVVAAIALNPPAVVRRFTELASGWEHAGGSRLVIWQEAMAVISRHPVLGVGPDSYRLAWYPLESSTHAALGLNSVVTDPHNVVLNLASTVGIPAAIAGVGMIAVVLGSKARDALGPGSDPRRLVVSGWWCAVLALSVALFFSVATVVSMAGLMLGLGAVATAAGHQVQPRRRRDLGIAVAAICLAGLFAVISTMSLASDYALGRAQIGDRLTFSEKAVAWAPWNLEARRQAADELSQRAMAAYYAGDSRARQMMAEADRRTASLIAFNPYEPNSYFLRARFLTGMGMTVDRSKLRSAVEVADAGLKVHPYNVWIRTQKAAALAELGATREVVTTLSPVWRNATTSEPGIRYAEALALTGRLADAESVLVAVRRRFSQDTATAGEIERVRNLISVEESSAP